MLKHEINFNGKKIALDQQDIVELLPALEPYFVAIMTGHKDFEIPDFVKEYMANVSENRGKVKQGEPVKKEKTQHYENNVYDFNEHKKEERSNG